MGATRAGPWLFKSAITNSNLTPAHPAYSPAELDAQIAPAKLAGFRFGFDEAYDHGAAIAEAASLAGNADLALVMTAAGKSWESEGFDRPDLQLPRLQNALVEAVRARQERTVVVNVTGAAVEMPWAFGYPRAEDAGRPLVPAVVQTWYGGQEAGLALVDVLLGRGAAPASGRMCTSWPRVVGDQPAGGDEGLFPGRDVTGRGHPDTHYKEGRLVGYKWYEAKALSPATWFGGGLGGYASFERKLLAVKGSLSSKDGSGKVQVEVQVRNTSEKFSGKDVVQVYVALPESLVHDDVPPKRVSAGVAARRRGRSTIRDTATVLTTMSNTQSSLPPLWPARSLRSSAPEARRVDAAYAPPRAGRFQSVGRGRQRRELAGPPGGVQHRAGFLCRPQG